MNDINGFSDHEILVDVSTDLKQHIKDSQETEIEIAIDLAARPTRREIISWIGGAGVLVGIVMALA